MRSERDLSESASQLTRSKEDKFMLLPHWRCVVAILSLLQSIVFFPSFSGFQVYYPSFFISLLSCFALLKLLSPTLFEVPSIFFRAQVCLIANLPAPSVMSLPVDHMLNVLDKLLISSITDRFVCVLITIRVRIDLIELFKFNIIKYLFQYLNIQYSTNSSVFN